MTEQIITAPKKERVHILDGIRGIAIFLMVLHHLTYNMTYIFADGSPFAEFCRAAYNSEIVTMWLQPIFQSIFVFVSGVACRYSRNNLKRGAYAFLFGTVLEIITCAILPAISFEMFDGCQIHFGILSCLGFCMMFWGIFGDGIDKLTEKKFVKFITPAVLFVLWFAAYKMACADYPFEGLYWLGLPSDTFSSADYFPVMPWIFVFIAGAFFGRFIKDGMMPKWFYRARIPFFDFIGRYTIWIYLLHQPVVFGLCYLFFVIFKR